MSGMENKTPRQIDTRLAEIYQARSPLEANVAIGQNQRRQLFDDEKEAIVQNRPVKLLAIQSRLSDAGDALGDAIAKLRAFNAVHRDEINLLEGEYNTRRWSRFFLVTSSAGHIHSHRNCNTCHLTTQYGWLPDLSGQSEEMMVRKHGEAACTVCFPTAPTMEGWQESIDRKKAESCTGSGRYVESARGRYPKYTKCDECSETVSVSRGGKVRKHKTC